MFAMASLAVVCDSCLTASTQSNATRTALTLPTPEAGKENASSCSDSVSSFAHTHKQQLLLKLCDQLETQTKEFRSSASRE